MASIVRSKLSPRMFIRKYVPTEVYPLLAIVGLSVSAASFMIYRVSQDSDVVWDHRKKDWAPWEKVKYDQNLKLYAVDRDFWTKRKLEAQRMQSRQAEDMIHQMSPIEA